MNKKFLLIFTIIGFFLSLACYTGEALAPQQKTIYTLRTALKEILGQEQGEVADRIFEKLEKLDSYELFKVQYSGDVRKHYGICESYSAIVKEIAKGIIDQRRLDKQQRINEWGAWVGGITALTAVLSLILSIYNLRSKSRVKNEYEKNNS